MALKPKKEDVTAAFYFFSATHGKTRQDGQSDEDSIQTVRVCKIS